MLKQWCNSFIEISSPGLVPLNVFSVMKGAISAIESLPLCWGSIICDMQRVSHITHNPIGKQKFQIEKSKKYWKKKLVHLGRIGRRSWTMLYGHRTAFKTPIGMSPFHLIFGKPCHFPLELEHYAMWVIRNINFDLKEAVEKRLLQLNRF